MSFAKSKVIPILCVILAFLPTNIHAHQKQIAFTFDDGPHYKYTAEILDILNKYNVKATFFTVGSNIERFPEIAEREHREGHQVANHTFSHRHMKELDENELTKEILKCESLIYNSDDYPKFFRPPEGVLSEENVKVIKELGYTPVLWDIDTKDWAHASVENIVENVLKNAKDGSVVLFHDFVSGTSSTPKAIDILIPKLKEMGYRFVTVSEMKKFDLAS
ncbi:MAG: polysaccharide deacetylase family protein [Clostridia bacterium]|nr:polysaccharide deacetylase family protein [Clostridia bacterium]